MSINRPFSFHKNTDFSISQDNSSFLKFGYKNKTLWSFKRYSNNIKTPFQERFKNYF